MASKQKPAEAVKLSRSQIDKLWDAITVNDWLNLPNSGALAARRYKQDEIICLCPHPDHSDSSPSFHIYTKQRHGYCFGCGYRPTDPIELTAHILDQPYSQAFQHITNNVLGAAPLRNTAYVALLEQQFVTQRAKLLFYDICHEQMVLAAEAYLAGLAHKAATQKSLAEEDVADCNFQTEEDEDYPGELLGGSAKLLPDAPEMPDNVIPITGSKDGVGVLDFDYAMATIRWLVEVRNLPVELLDSLPIGIVPPLSAMPALAKSTMTKQGLNPEYDSVELLQSLTNFLSAEHNRGATSLGTGAVIFPLCTTDSHITAFRARQPNAPGESKRINLFQDGFEPGTGFFGVNFKPYVNFLKNRPDGKSKSYIMVEGEFDALQPMVHALQTGKVEHAIISAGGNSAITLLDDFVTTNDIDRLQFLGDAPTKGHVDSSSAVIYQWLKHTSKCNISIFSDEAWAKLSPGEDLDHAYAEANLSVDLISKVLTDPASFIPAWRWVFNRSLSSFEEYAEDDVQALTQAAVGFGQYLRTPGDIDAFADSVVNLYPALKAGPIKRGVTATSDDEQGFIARIADTLQDLYDVIGVANNPRSGKDLQLFHKKDSRIALVKLDSDQSIVQELAQTAGAPSRFIADYVGTASCLLNPESEAAKKGNSSLAQDRKIRHYLSEAVLSLALDAPCTDNLKKVRAGYHFLPNQEILIQGKSVFFFDRRNGDLKFREEKTARADDLLIDIYQDPEQRKEWFTPEPLTTEVLYKAQKSNMRKAYNDLCRFFDTGFVFDHQSVNCRLLAALTLAFPIMSVFDRQVVVHFTGDTGSGKSTLLSTFCKVDKDTSNMSIQLLYGSRYFLSITQTAFTRVAANTALLHCIDELEFDSQTKRKNSEGVMESLRGITSGGGSRTVSRMDGEGTVTQEYNVPVIYASITGTEKPQDLNRLIVINMQKREGQVDPNSAIYRAFPQDDLYKLRLAVNFGMYQHVPDIRARYEKIRHQYTEINSQLPVKVEFRFMSAFFPLFAVMDAIDVDYIAFFSDYVRNNEILIRRNTGISESDGFMSKILHFSGIALQDFKDTQKKHTLAEVLVNRAWRLELNNTGVGVFYDESSHLMLFNLEQVITNLLSSYSRNSTGITAMGLRNMLERHKAALTPQEIASSGIMRRAAMHMGAGLRLSDVVVFHGQHWLNEYAENAKTSYTPEPVNKVEPPEAKQPEDSNGGNAADPIVWY